MCVCALTFVCVCVCARFPIVGWASLGGPTALPVCCPPPPSCSRLWEAAHFLLWVLARIFLGLVSSVLCSPPLPDPSCVLFADVVGPLLNPCVGARVRYMCVLCGCLNVLLVKPVRDFVSFLCSVPPLLVDHVCCRPFLIDCVYLGS